MGNIYQRIKHLRELNNMTQQELANKLGYKSRSTINKIESGMRDISQSQILEFANAFNVSPAYLMGLSEDLEQQDDEDTIVLARKLGTLDDSQIQLINQMIDQFEKNKDKDHE